MQPNKFKMDPDYEIFTGDYLVVHPSNIKKSNNATKDVDFILRIGKTIEMNRSTWKAWADLEIFSRELILMKKS